MRLQSVFLVGDFAANNYIIEQVQVRLPDLGVQRPERLQP
jgi:hypothetical protein